MKQLRLELSCGGAVDMFWKRQQCSLHSAVTWQQCRFFYSAQDVRQRKGMLANCFGVSGEMIVEKSSKIENSTHRKGELCCNHSEDVGRNNSRARDVLRN